ncbi:MAG: TonB-dependent receptor [Ignavibacteriaceae bacterium]|jgi:outer membrane receptor protein involved in Fe transport|nr:TonB-dependent receptor [Ignavibacteriaceae bacterium]
MKKSILSFLLVFLFPLLFNSSQTFAGVTGKIAGKVTDAQTGEELIGINILVEGSTTGAATGIDGTYIINNIEPGTYTLIVSGVGYQKQIVKDVKVSSDFTTRIDIQLSSVAISLETIVVEAQNPMIRKDLTSSKTVVDESQIQTLPVESLDQILTLQAGITKGASGEIHIRGGRSSEVSYNVNGVSTVNPFDFSRTVTISTNAVQELSVVSGTFNAEYGNALSGIVNTVTKEGGANYRGTISFYTGDYASAHSSTFLNINKFNPFSNHVVEGTIGGPVPVFNNAITFFISGRYNESKGYLYGKKLHTIYDSIWVNPNDIEDIRVAATGDNSIVPMNPSEDFSGTAKITIKPFSAFKINYDVVYSNSNYQTYSHNFKYNPDANYNRYEWSLLNSLEIRHALSGNTFYSLQGAHNIYDYKRYLFPLLDAGGNEVSFKPGMDISKLHADPRYQPTFKLNRTSTYTFYAGGTLNDQYYQRSHSTEIKFDLTSQVDNQHEIKFGAKFKNDLMDFEDFTIQRDTSQYLTPTILGPESPVHDLYSKEPRQFSAYVQDKMEFTSMIINAGIRYDLFDSRAEYAPDIYTPTKNLKMSETKNSFSPRLGISFPITDQGIIHFSYGHFYQLPPYSYLYTNPTFEDNVANPTYGNANLNPEKTVTYEIGLQQQLSDAVAFNVTGFFKDVRDLLALQKIRTSVSSYYYKYVNKDYGNIKGITFSLTKRTLPAELFALSLDYTFQVAEGNDTGADAFFLDLASGRQSEKIPVPLNWDQSHTLNGVISFGNERDWFVTIVGNLSTGLPYTPYLYDKQIYLRANSERKPLQTNVDLRIEKSIDLSDFMLTVFLKVYNLFDTRNELFVYDDTGRSTYTMELNQGGPRAANELSDKNPLIPSATEYFNQPQFYSAPREVMLGLMLEF